MLRRTLGPAIVAALTVVLVSTAVALTAGATRAVAQSCREPVRADIEDVVGKWQAAITSGDADAIAAFYADDAVLLPTASDAPRTGRAAIQAYFAEFAARHPMATITMRSIVTGCGMASDIGTARYLVTGVRKGTRMFVGGRFATVLVERDGRWLIAQQSLSLAPVPNRK